MSNIKTPDFSNAQVGDKLWDSATDEWVTIEAIDLSSPMSPILLRFDNVRTCISCRLSGRTSFAGPVRFYWRKFEIPDECFVRPKPTQ